MGFSRVTLQSHFPSEVFLGGASSHSAGTARATDAAFQVALRYLSGVPVLKSKGIVEMFSGPILGKGTLSQPGEGISGGQYSLIKAGT